MNLVRIVFLGLAVLLPASWTVAKAADEAPAGDTTKTTKKTKKSKKKADGSSETETKTDTKTEK
ncbi:MAG TPA: hypothetical protein VN962_12820 [Polyangia bacterium]|jgi:hypothetical protein|nr:hypothetical protein [Polyangia bacterium]